MTISKEIKNLNYNLGLSLSYFYELKSLNLLTKRITSKIYKIA